MAIKPVDFQVMIPRAVEAAKATNDETGRNSSMQQQLASSTRANAEQSTRKVNQQKSTQDVGIKERQEHQEHQERRKREGGGSNENEAGEEAGHSKLKGKSPGKPGRSMQTSTIDIKV